VEPCPGVTSIPGWTPPLTLQVLDVSELAPKDEDLIYRQHAQMFRWRHEEWNERGTGDVMLLRNKETGFTRFLMWQDKTYKTIANFNLIESSSHCSLNAHEDDPKTWEWCCQDHSDDQPNDEKFALHFKTDQLACRFKDIFDEAKTRFKNDVDDLLFTTKPGDSSLSTLPASTCTEKWKCDGCLLQVSSDKLICPCCELPCPQKSAVEVTNAVESVSGGRLFDELLVQFVGQFAKAPKIKIDQSLIAQHEKELWEAQNVAIGDDDEDL